MGETVLLSGKIRASYNKSGVHIYTPFKLFRPVNIYFRNMEPSYFESVSKIFNSMSNGDRQIIRESFALNNEQEEVDFFTGRCAAYLVACSLIGDNHELPFGTSDVLHRCNIDYIKALLYLDQEKHSDIYCLAEEFIELFAVSFLSGNYDIQERLEYHMKMVNNFLYLSHKAYYVERLNFESRVQARRKRIYRKYTRSQGRSQGQSRSVSKSSSQYRSQGRSKSRSRECTPSSSPSRSETYSVSCSTSSDASSSSVPNCNRYHLSPTLSPRNTEYRRCVHGYEYHHSECCDHSFSNSSTCESSRNLQCGCRSCDLYRPVFKKESLDPNSNLEYRSSSETTILSATIDYRPMLEEFKKLKIEIEQLKKKVALIETSEEREFSLIL